ncbi:MAG: dipeptidase [Gracilibacter sp. BRH_c7a]|nr:MAG: dipeptidase [Gracilibacter sp. BRH_c7a]
MDQFKETVSSAKDEMIKALQDCLKIKSTTGTDGVHKALDFYLNLAKDMGFTVKNIEKLGGLIEFGQGPKTIGLIVHLDTVPEGSGWSFPPFEGQIQNGKIYGRGAIDDKGPAIATLYALKAIKDSDSQLQNKFQIIVGIDEEDVWTTTPQLLKKIKEPDFSFVPDSKFPLVIAEKGLIWLELAHDFNKQAIPKKSLSMIIKNMQGGGSLNIVPESCEALLTGDIQLLSQVKTKLADYLNKTKSNIRIEENGSDIKLVSQGKSAHAFNCQEGINAIAQLILFLNELDINTQQKEFLSIYSKKIGMECFGESLGIQMEDKVSGKLTISPGEVLMNDTMVKLKVDLRFPATSTLDSVKRKVLQAFQEFSGDIKILDSLESLSFPEDDPHITKLMQVYKDYTGDTEAKPLGMGGTTFAKAFKNAVAFGPTFPGMAKVEHQPDEYMEIDHLIRCTEIYALAINELGKS